MGISPEEEARRLEEIFRKSTEFISTVKEFIAKQAPEQVEDIETLKDEKVILRLYDSATDSAVEVGILLARAWVVKSEMRTAKLLISKRDIKVRRMLSGILGDTDLVATEIDDMIQALCGIKSGLESKARFFEKAQYLLYAQKTFV